MTPQGKRVDIIDAILGFVSCALAMAAVVFAYPAGSLDGVRRARREKIAQKARETARREEDRLREWRRNNPPITQGVIELYAAQAAAAKAADELVAQIAPAAEDRPAPPRDG